MREAILKSVTDWAALAEEQKATSFAAGGTAQGPAARRHERMLAAVDLMCDMGADSQAAQRPQVNHHIPTLSQTLTLGVSQGESRNLTGPGNSLIACAQIYSLTADLQAAVSSVVCVHLRLMPWRISELTL